MKRSNGTTVIACVALALFVAGSARAVLGAAGGELARAVMKRVGMQGGVACVIGADNPEMAIGLAKEGSFLVHVIDADGQKIAAAQEKIAASGLLGRSVYVETNATDRLPHADHLLDLVVAAEDCPIPEREILRALAPVRGKAILGDRVFTKPPLPGSDDWTHRLHGPDNNPVSADTAFQMPAMLQYLALPMQTSFHGTLLVADGLRIELSDWVTKKPDRDAVAGKLLGRSLYNGQILWQRELPQKIEPDQPIVAAGAGRVYLATGDACRIQVVEVATGKEEPSLSLSTEPQLRVKWLAIENGSLYALLGPELPVRAALQFPLGSDRREIRLDQAKAGRIIVCLALHTGQPRWRHEEPVTIDHRTIAVRDGRTYFYSENTRLACLDAQGKVHWENRDSSWLKTLVRPRLFANVNIEGDSTLIVGPAGQLRMALPGLRDGLIFSAVDGQRLWQDSVRGPKSFFLGQRYCSPAGMFDAATGQQVGPCVFEGGGCGVATWVPGLEKGVSHVSFGFKSPCGVGTYAAGGLLVVAPSQCDCGPIQRGAAGLAAAADILARVRQQPEHPLERGTPPAASLQTAAGDWPQYRGDGRRTGGSALAAGLSAKLRWTAKPESLFPVPEGRDRHRLEWLERPTPPVTAGGLAFCGASDGSVRAVTIADGQPAWTFWTGGAVLTAPAIDGGRVYIGSGDGWVYCLDAATGTLAWRWRSAPAPRGFMVYGKLMSSWPVTSVLVRNGSLYGVAGQWMQNGVVTFALDAATGQPRWRHWTEPTYDPGTTLQRREDPGFSPAGNLALVGGNLWVRTYLGVPAVFDAASGRVVPPTAELVENQRKNNAYRMSFLTAGQDILVLDDHLVLQGGYPLLGPPDIRHDKIGAKYIAYRVDADGQVPGRNNPTWAIPHSQIAPAVSDQEVLLVGGVGRSGRSENATLGLSLWNVDAWKEHFAAQAAMGLGKDTGDDSGDPSEPKRKTTIKNPLLAHNAIVTTLDMTQARWRLDEADVNAVVLCRDAAVAVVGQWQPGQRKRYGVYPEFAEWKLVALDRATGRERWSVELPGEPVFNGLAPAADSSWVVALRDGSLACVGCR